MNVSKRASFKAYLRATFPAFRPLQNHLISEQQKALGLHVQNERVAVWSPMRFLERS